MHFCFISGAPKHTLKSETPSHSELDRGTLTLGTPNPAVADPLRRVQKQEGWPTAPSH